MYQVTEYDLDAHRFKPVYCTNSRKAAFEVRDFLRWKAQEWEINCIYGIFKKVTK